MTIRIFVYWALSLTVLLVASLAAQEPLIDPADGVSEDEAVPVLEEPAASDTGEPELEALLKRLKALEDSEKTRKEAEKEKKEADKLKKEAEEEKKKADAKKPTIKWTGQVQSDFVWFNQDDANKATVGDIENGSAFRRARFGMLGDYGPAQYRIEMDFALNGRPTILDAWTGLTDLPALGTVRVGHFFEPFSLDRYTPNRFMTFMERSLPDQPFAPARNLGVMAQNTWNEKHGTWAVGLFRSDSDVFGDETGDPFESAVTGRVTALPWYLCDGSEFLHLGVGYSWRDANNQTARFRAQPEGRVGSSVPAIPFFVDTGNISAHNFQLIGLESAWVSGPLSLQGEYILTPVNARGADTLYFSGWYCTASYFLTGEHRPYRRETATFDRVTPRREFLRYSTDKCLETGPGAWEVAARISHLDFDDDFVRGGNLTDLTIGLNWYLSPYLRVTANFVRAFLDDSQDGKSHTDIYAMRVGFEF